jgi:hypothetical protein
MTERTLADCVLGVDPGFGGALALLTLDPLSVVGHWPMPTLQVQRASGIRSDFDYSGIRAWWQGHGHRVAWVALENLQPRPGTSGISSYAMGRARAMWEGWCAAHDLVVVYIYPGQWKPMYQIGKGPDDSVRAAEKVFKPDPFVNVRTVAYRRAVADALLIAHYARWQHKQRQGKAPT